MGLTFCLIIISVIFSSCVCLIPYGSNNSDMHLPCADYGTIEFGFVKTINLGNQYHALHIECDPGYHLVGKHKLLCIDGQWDQVPRPQCIGTNNVCRTPPNVSNGAITLEGEKDGVGMYLKGTLITYVCNDGYRLVPPESKYRVCEKGIWTGAMGQCILVGCKPPKDIENGYYVPEKNGVIEEFNVGQRVYYSCNSGYILNGSPIQQCIDDGSWSPRISPVCALETNGKFHNIGCCGNYRSLYYSHILQENLF